MVRYMWARALLACFTLAALAVTIAAGAISGCPAGIAAVTLAWDPQSSWLLEADRVGSVALKPSAFALPAEVSSGLIPGSELTSYGEWGEAATGALAWKLCIGAPAALSLTLLLREVQLPLGAQLFVYNPAISSGPGACTAGCLQLTVQDLRAGGDLLAGPVAGEVAVLEYLQADSHVQPRHPFSAVVQSVLLGVRPLPALSLQQQARNAQQPGAGAGAGPGAGAALAGAAGKGAAGQGGAAGLGTTLRAGSVELGGAAAGGAGDGVASNTAGGAALATLASVDDSAVVQANKIEDRIRYALQRRANSSLACNVNVACDPDWAKEANAVVLVMAFDATGGYFCTGTLINSPDATQYLATANHCLRFEDSLGTVHWGVLFNYDAPCRPSGYVPPYRLLQGVDLVWHNEVADVLLLQLDDEIPEEFAPYFLGWNASGWVQPYNGSACIHHPVGDVKKIAYTFNPLDQGSYLVPGPTHYIVTWSRGVTEEGSSGAMLIDATTKLGLGVLTGSPSSAPICDQGVDYFGSLHEAWELGLWEFLGSDGIDGPAAMGPRGSISDGPGLFVTPDQLVVQEGGDPVQVQISLSDPPQYGEQIIVRIAVSPSMAPPVNVSTQEMTFAGFDWNVPQTLLVAPGDDALRVATLPFQLVLTLRSDQNTTFTKRRVVKGVRMDDDISAGSTAAYPISITSLPFNTTGGLLPSRAIRPLITVGNTTLSQFSQRLRPGSGAYYSFSPAQRRGVTLGACSNVLRLQMAVFVDNVARWSSAEDCGGLTNPKCGTSKVPGDACVGFNRIELPAVDDMEPHTIVVYSVTAKPGSFEFEVVASRTD